MEDRLPDNLPMRVRTMQIIVLALALGIASFFVIATYLRTQQPAPAQGNQLPIISIVAGFFTVGPVAAFFLVPRLIVNSARGRLAPERRLAPALQDQPLDWSEKLLGVYQTKLIVAAALLEGPAFFLMIAYLLEGQLWTLVLAAFLLAGVVAQFPTQPGVTSWLQEQMRLIEGADAGP
ncbi:MAG: hypothetical protein AB7K24_13645 [Gemmataceae bacterium]